MTPSTLPSTNHLAHSEYTHVNYPIEQYRLDNGLRLIVSSDPHAPGVAVNLWYHVGSSDEVVHRSGFAHLFEHLMFAGSSQVASGEHLASIQAVGGSANATTSFDRTNYYETVPPHAVDLALWLEADRMASLRVDDHNLNTQRDVVKEEKRQRYDNVPYGDQLELLLQLNFPDTHPYAHPVIGSMDDLNAATLDDVQQFYHRWYQPSSAVLTLVGAITPELAYEKVDHYFSPITSHSSEDHQILPPLDVHKDHPSLVVKRDVPRSVSHLCWRTPPIDHPDRLAVDMALELLAGNESSRLVALMERELGWSESVSTYDFSLARSSSLAVISCVHLPDSSPQRSSERICAELDRIIAEGPSPDEVARTRASLERQWLASLSPLDQRADFISMSAVHFSDPNRINRELDEAMRLDSDDIRQALCRWLHPDAVAELLYEVKR